MEKLGKPLEMQLLQLLKFVRFLQLVLAGWRGDSASPLTQSCSCGLKVGQEDILHLHIVTCSRRTQGNYSNISQSGKCVWAFLSTAWVSESDSLLA